jgi:chaperonin cofactor prefoldin
MGILNVYGGTGILTTNSTNNSHIYLNLSDDKSFKDLMKRVEIIEQRLAILHPNEELQEKFESLKEAYDAYKIIERLVDDSGK